MVEAAVATPTPTVEPQAQPGGTVDGQPKEYLFDDDTGSLGPVPNDFSSEPAQPGTGEGEPAPGTGEGGDGKGEGTKPADPPKGEGTAQEPEIKDEDLESALGFGETPEQKSARLEREYSASTKEALRLKKVADGLGELLQSQAIEVVTDEEGVPIGLAPGKGFLKGNGDIAVNFKALSEDEQALFDNDPQKAIDLVLDRAKSGLIKVAPTVESAIKPLSPERITAAIEHVKGMTDAAGEPLLATFEQDLPLVDRMLKAPNAPKALKDLHKAEPELAYELLSIEQKSREDQGLLF